LIVILISVAASLVRLCKLGGSGRAVGVVTVVLCFLLAALSPSLAASKEEATLTQKQKIVNRQTLINDVTDYFATRGTSGPEKAHILKQRKEARRVERLQDLQRR